MMNKTKYLKEILTILGFKTSSYKEQFKNCSSLVGTKLNSDLFFLGSRSLFPVVAFKRGIAPRTTVGLCENMRLFQVVKR